MKTMANIAVAVLLLATASVASAENLLLALSYRKGQIQITSPEKWIVNANFYKNFTEGKDKHFTDPGFKNFYDAGLGEKSVRFASVGILSAAIIHPWGHVTVAENYGIAASINYKTMSEPMALSKDARKKTDIFGAGFEFQGSFSEVANTSEVYLFNAVYLLLYFPVDAMTHSNYPKGGDINEMRIESGNKYVKEILTVCAIADLTRSFTPKALWNVHFSTFRQGVPGLVFSIFINENMMPVWSR